VSDLARTGYNHIDKLDFLADYPRARIEAFQPNIIQSSFAATGIARLVPKECFLSSTYRFIRLRHHQADQAADLANSPQKRLRQQYS
jgi:hypothetical protein